MKLVLAVILILSMAVPVLAGEKEDLQKDLALIQERLGRLSAEIELTKMQGQQIQEKLRLVLEKEKAEVKVKKDEEEVK